ncbi:hypothetical protein PG997_003374 [Apiospora hydei]|uniref:Uncharacterized protein n=1 Tax=Apiospora hydei TaxID=1337664 RepID=A0ABR1WZ46_9PEZI
MLPQLKIHVNGNGSVFRTAERGVLNIRVSTTDKSQQTASDGVRETSAKLTAKFRAHAPKTDGADGRPAPHPDAGITAFTASSISTDSQPEYEWVDGKRRDLGLTYRASCEFEVVFRDLTLLADAAGELSSMPRVSIVSTEWRLTAATRAEIEREARKKAIENAVQKAQDYSDVVGRAVVAVEIKDGPASSANSITNPWRPGFSTGGGLFGGGGMMQQQQMQQQHMQMQQQQQQALQQQVLQQQGQRQASMAVGQTDDAQVNDGPSVEPRTITASAMVNVKFISVDGEPVDI